MNKIGPRDQYVFRLKASGRSVDRRGRLLHCVGLRTRIRNVIPNRGREFDLIAILSYLVSDYSNQDLGKE